MRGRSCRDASLARCGGQRSLGDVADRRGDRSESRSCRRRNGGAHHRRSLRRWRHRQHRRFVGDRCHRRVVDVDYREDRHPDTGCVGRDRQPSGGRTGSLPGGFTYEADTAPTISSVIAQGTRPHEPKNFADLDEEIAVTAAVDDPDTPADRLTFEWKADEGTINGSGATVTWRAPADAATPKSVTLTVNVSDPGSNRTTGTVNVSLHNSTKEVGDLARQFLLDFSDSKNDRRVRRAQFHQESPMRGRSRRGVQRDRRESEDLPDRRIRRLVLLPSTSSSPSLPCSYRPRDGDACAVGAVQVGQRLRAGSDLHAGPDPGGRLRHRGLRGSAVAVVRELFQGATARCSGGLSGNRGSRFRQGMR